MHSQHCAYEICRLRNDMRKAPFRLRKIAPASARRLFSDTISARVILPEGASQGSSMILRVFLFVAFVAACAATALAQPAHAQAPADGVWRGTGLQVGKAGEKTWTVKLTVDQHGKSLIEYPSLGCKGELTQV